MAQLESSRGLHVTGASGSGTTTLARAVADAWAVPHADVDDYFWLPTDPPYLDKRPALDRVALMEQMFLPREGWVLFGSMLGWGDDVVGRCDAVVVLTLDPAGRMRRIEARERVRRERGPADESALEEFLTWARGDDNPSFEGRSRAAHEEWLTTLTCPVPRLDSALTREEPRDTVLAWVPPA